MPKKLSFKQLMFSKGCDLKIKKPESCPGFFYINFLFNQQYVICAFLSLSCI